METVGLEDFRSEMLLRSAYEQWPVHLVVQWPDCHHHLPVMMQQWHSLVDSRLVATLSPQLDACGFFTRPMCMDNPFVFLLWPQEAAWTRHVEIEVLLPLRRRVSRVLFLMLLEAHRSMWPQKNGPALRDLVPEVRLMRHLPDAQTSRISIYLFFRDACSRSWPGVSEEEGGGARRSEEE